MSRDHPLDTRYPHAYSVLLATATCCLFVSGHRTPLLADDNLPSAETYRMLGEADVVSLRDLRRFLPSASEDEVRALAGARNHVVALHCSWRLVSNQLRAGAGCVDASAFFQVVEDRLSVQPPEWWRRVASSAYLHEGWQVVRFNVRPYRPYVRSKAGIFTPIGTSIEEIDGKWIVTGPKHGRLRIDPEQLGFARWHPSLSVGHIQGRTFLSHHSSQSELHWVFEYQAETGNLKEVAFVRRAGFPIHGAPKGPLGKTRWGEHAVSFDLADDQLIVFGAAENFIYFEAFDTGGRSLLGFNSSSADALPRGYLERGELIEIIRRLEEIEQESKSREQSKPKD